jgi:hypothetical protein
MVRAGADPLARNDQGSVRPNAIKNAQARYDCLA